MGYRFEDPWLLLLVLPAGYALWQAYAGRRRQIPVLPFPDTTRTQALRPDAWTALLKNLPRVLSTLAVLLVVLGLARPQKTRILPAEDQSGADIMLVIDTSGSMRALDFNPKNRILAAKEAARDFIRHRTSDRIGIVVFAGTAQLQCPLTLDYAALLDYLDLVDVGILNSENTAIGDALGTAVNHLRDSPSRNKVIVLLTDGRNNSGEIDPTTAAQAAQSMGIKVYTVGTGAKGPALFPVDDPVFGRRLVRLQEDLDEASLIVIARLTGGEYFRATNLNELFEIYRTIDRLEKIPQKIPPRTEHNDLYAWLLTPALLLLLAEAALSRTWLLTLP